MKITAEEARQYALEWKKQQRELLDSKRKEAVKGIDAFFKGNFIEKSIETASRNGAASVTITIEDFNVPDAGLAGYEYISKKFQELIKIEDDDWRKEFTLHSSDKWIISWGIAREEYEDDIYFATINPDVKL